MEAITTLWKLSSVDRFLLQQWQESEATTKDEVILYDCKSGDLYIITPASAAIITMLKHESVGADEIFADLRQQEEFSDHFQSRDDLVENCLNPFLALGVLEKVEHR